MIAPDSQYLADRLAISDLLTRYAHALDTSDWDLWRTVFTPDAHVDYTSAGGAAGDVETVGAWLQETFEMFSMTQHLIANQSVVIDGDTATVRAMFYNPMKFASTGDLMTTGGFYNHELVRTVEGWKSRRLVEESSWFQS